MKSFISLYGGSNENLRSQLLVVLWEPSPPTQPNPLSTYQKQLVRVCVHLSRVKIEDANVTMPARLTFVCAIEILGTNNLC